VPSGLKKALGIRGWRLWFGLVSGLPFRFLGAFFAAEMQKSL
jgi:hypothetical protein